MILRGCSSMRAVAHHLLTHVWDAVFPRFCVGCSAEGDLLCRKCDESWAPARPFLWHKEQEKAVHDIAELWVMAQYADPLTRGLVTAWKYHYDDSAWQTLQRRFAPCMSGFALTLAMHNIAAIVPLPLTKKRRCERGFDQAVSIATWLSAATGIPMLPLLTRGHREGHQAEKTEEQRKTAMVDSPFSLFSPLSLPSHVLLVDDVWTTGSTMDAGARTLKAAGVEEVYGFALAKGS